MTDEIRKAEGESKDSAAKEQSGFESNMDQADASPSPEDGGDKPSEMTLLETLQSVLWAMLGVQNKRNAKRDFSKGKPSHFIIIGIIFAAVFVITLIVLVKLIIGNVMPTQ